MALRTLLALLFVVARAPLKLASNFGANQALPADHRGDEDNISPPISWSGAPKNAESFVLIVDSHDPASKCDGDDDSCSDLANTQTNTQTKGKKGKKKKGGPKTHWLIYDIPKDVKELREELSGAGSSDVARLGMKEDAGQAPVVVDPMGQIDGWVDPEIKAMEDMIHNAVDMSFEDKNRAKEGKNSYGGTYYRGPSEEGMLTTFKLYALSGRLDHLPRGASREQVIKAMKGKVLDKATLTAKVA